MPQEPLTPLADAEAARLREDGDREANWKRWGPYLSERQWGTVREDYSADGDAWSHFPHDHARSRVYRWGEDGLLGFCDRQGRVCFSLALWNGKDPILKERLFGLTGPEGNHGEDVKELYYYLDSTPTHSYCKALYKYPQCEFPYRELIEEARRRGRQDPEFDPLQTKAFDDDRYFDVTVEYAKATPEDILIRITVENRGPDAAPITVLPTLWHRNTWSWGRTGEGYWKKGSLSLSRAGRVRMEHESLGIYHFEIAPIDGAVPRVLFTENESNKHRLWGTANATPWVKDAFHRYVINGHEEAVSPYEQGTKCAAHVPLVVPAGGRVVLKLRLRADKLVDDEPFSADFDEVFAQRIAEADAFYETRIPSQLTVEEKRVARQAYAGLLWSKQFYHFVVRHWLEGDPSEPPPPKSRNAGRNADWGHLFNRDVVSMPDKWEYPWYAAWDLAFHMLAFARIDIEFAKGQLLLFLREWYMHPNGQLPAYEWQFSDVNPPVHAWAAFRIYKMSGPPGKRDTMFLKRVFSKLLLNFNWWVNRKDVEGNNLFGGGFLGLDNIGIFDRSKPLPTGGHLEQADGTAWMAFYCVTMLGIALELAREDTSYEDLASKFFEHFLSITDAMNSLGGSGLWNEDDGFYYDQLSIDGHHLPLRIRSMVGLLPLIAAEVLDEHVMDRMRGFAKRAKWFIENRQDVARHITYMTASPGSGAALGHEIHGPPYTEVVRARLLAVPSRERLVRVLRYLLDENEFLSTHGIRSLSRVHEAKPYVLSAGGETWEVRYVPAESDSALFGGNSNWRGPVWFPVNYLLIEALERYHHFYGDTLSVECPTGSGHMMTLGEVAAELARRLTLPFLPNERGARPCHGPEDVYASSPHFRDLVLFHEYFHGETGRGLGASHQTGWTALVVRCLEDVARARAHGAALFPQLTPQSQGR